MRTFGLFAINDYDILLALHESNFLFEILLGYVIGYTNP